MITPSHRPKLYGAIVSLNGRVRWLGSSRSRGTLEYNVAVHWTRGTFWGIGETQMDAIAAAMDNPGVLGAQPPEGKSITVGLRDGGSRGFGSTR